MLFKILGGNFIQCAGRHLGSRDAQFLGFRQDLFALDTMLFCYVVYPNGHKKSYPAYFAKVSSLLQLFWLCTHTWCFLHLP
jgi:hypothetical protein